ncbi:Glutamate--tRNA ligase, mitochondrial [Diplodia seriata]|uniref:Glutamate--tRNA ligase, mitochondrial n=1 Tax=Diplodia seriata TaxID=420778 RepID=A0A1S8BKL3_9PEZI|nr:Glutamate--tRNA ligase, mitochondrial [Diplodia seriata]
MALLLSLASRRANFVCTSCSLRLSRAAVRQQSNHAAPKKPPKKTALPEGPARTRFAPSPTGYLHLGSLRTALFNYLLAKRTGGQFLLRIEDTDQKRTVSDAEARLLDDLKWAGLQWDEGPEVGGPYGPYRQSERTKLYQAHATKLLETGHAYRCFCTPERLNDLAQHRAQLGLPTDYDRKCAHIPKEEAEDRAAKGESHVVRLLVPDNYPAFFDLVYGMVGKAGKGTKPATKKVDDAYDDPIVLKSDGLPTYHLANVVDDHHMKITHVIRGTEWLPSTPRHVAMYNAFGWEPPAFAHVGLLVDEAGNKLSKRNMDIDVAYYQKNGYLPEVVNNFVALLGWSHRNRSDVMSMHELIDSFTIKFTKGNTTVTEDKLHYLQHQHLLRRMVPGDAVFDKTVDQLVSMLKSGDPISCDQRVLDGPSLRDYVAAVLRIDAKNYAKPSDFLADHAYFFTDFTTSKKCEDSDRGLLLQVYTTVFGECDWTAAALHKCIPEAANLIAAGRLESDGEKAARENLEEQIRSVLAQGKSEDETAAALHEHIAEAGEKIVEAGPPPNQDEVSDSMIKAAKKDMYKHLRNALADGKPGPGIADMMEVLGRKECLRRMERYCVPSHLLDTFLLV